MILYKGIIDFLDRLYLIELESSELVSSNFISYQKKK